MSGKGRRRRRRVERETPEFASMVSRMLRAHGRRVGAGDPIDLTRMVSMRAELEEAIATAVAGQVQAGYSWREVGEGLGVTREAAWQRYKSHVGTVNGSDRNQPA